MRHCKTLLLSAALLVTACTSLTVKKVDPYGPGDGIRYSLPQPFVIATPKFDGTVDYRVEMLPDESRTYAISSEAYLASQELLVKVNQGLLTELKWLNDDSAVATQMATSAGAVETARITAETAAAKAAATKADELEGKIQDAIVARDEAQADLDALEDANEADDDSVDDADIAKAKATLAKAKAKVLALRRRRNPTLNATGTEDSMNAPAANTGSKLKSAFGPVIFRVVETVDDKGKPNGLTLKAVSWTAAGISQRKFDSFVAPKPGTKPPVVPGTPKVDAPSLVLLQTVPSAGVKIKIGLTADIKSVKATTVLTEVDPGTPSNTPPTAKRINSKVVELTFKAGTKAAKYTLKIRVATDASMSLPIDIPVTVVP